MFEKKKLRAKVITASKVHELESYHSLKDMIIVFSLTPCKYF